MKLIVNADDLGLCEGVNQGIEAAYRGGIVRSTTILVNGEAYGAALSCLRRNPGLGAGVHLNITAGAPFVQGHKTLVDEHGMFRRNNKEPQCPLEPEEVLREWEAQLEQVLRDGVAPTHLDSHHHVHMRPELLPGFLQLAKRHSLPVRMPYRRELAAGAGVSCPDAFVGEFYGAVATGRHLTSLLAGCESEGVVELMCHPACEDARLPRISSYSRGREQELRALAGKAVQAWIERSGVALVNFSFFHSAKSVVRECTDLQT